MITFVTLSLIVVVVALLASRPIDRWRNGDRDRHGDDN